MKNRILCLTAVVFFILFSICSAAKEINPRGGGTEDYLWYKKRTPLAYTPDSYAPYEIFDPYGPQNVPLVSPRTMSLAE